MSKVKLLSNLQTSNGVIAEGKILTLPDEQSDKLISLGAAEATDEPETAALTDEPTPEVEPAADPLVTTPADGEPTPPAAEPPSEPTVAKKAPAPVSPPEPPTPEAPASSSTNLHLG